jgi:CheY-like chemotaxis protein
MPSNCSTSTCVDAALGGTVAFHSPDGAGRSPGCRAAACRLTGDPDRETTSRSQASFRLAAMRGANVSCNPEGVGLGFGLVVVDDNRSFIDVACALLERQGERVLGTACTSAKAMELVAELRPDIVLVDMALGDECGLDLARQLARKSSCPPVIILISAYSPADVTELIAASPAAGFLPKSDLSSDAIWQIVVRSGRLSANGQLVGRNGR